MSNPVNLTKFYSINVTGINGIVPKQSAITRSNTSLTPLSTNSSSSLFYSTPVINHLSLPTNSNSSASSGSSGHHLSNGKSSKHQGGYCNYSEYKSNVNSLASTHLNINSYFYAVTILSCISFTIR